MPVPSRAMNSQKALWTSPVSEHDDAPQRHRDGGDRACGGAGRPACSAGSTRAGTARRRRRRWRPGPRRDTPRLSWMSGASTARAPLSIQSTRRAKPTATSVVAPPARTAWPSDIASSPTPGRRSSGRTTSSRDDLLGLAAGLLLEDGEPRASRSSRVPSRLRHRQPSIATGSPGRSTNSWSVGVVVGQEEVVAGVVLVRGDRAGRPGVQRDLAEPFDGRGSPWPG